MIHFHDSLKEVGSMDSNALLDQIHTLLDSVHGVLLQERERADLTLELATLLL